MKSNQLFCSIDNIGNIGTVVQMIEFEMLNCAIDLMMVDEITDNYLISNVEDILFDL